MAHHSPLITHHSSLSLTGRRPVFVVGHPRSGTTLVQLLITAHPVFSSAPETHFFTHVLAETPDWLNRTLRADELPMLFKRLAGKPGIKLDDATKTGLIQQAEHGGIAPAALLDAIMQFYAAQQHKPESSAIQHRWLEKTPRHVNHIPEILKLFPDARIINIVRDPRDVVSSNVHFQKLSREADRAERHYICIQRSLTWNQMVRFAQQIQPHESRLLTIRYEDLIADPEGNLARLMAFVGIEGDAAAAGAAIESFSSHYQEVALEKEVHKQLCAAGEIVDRRGIWKKRMTDEEAQLVDTLCAAVMAQNGYTTEFPPVPVKVRLEKLRYELPLEIRRVRSGLYRQSRQGAGKVLRRLGLKS